MSWANSFVPSATFRDSLANTIALDDGNTYNIALYDTSFAQTIDDDPFSYSATHEVTGTNWGSGGVALSSYAVTLVSTTGVKIDAADVSVASTTISTGVLGAVIYDDSLISKGRACCGLLRRHVLYHQQRYFRHYLGFQRYRRIYPSLIINS